MSDELKPAVSALQRKLEQQIQGVTETKKAINILLKMMDEPPMYADDDSGSGVIRPDQFYGKQFATAAAEYLSMRKVASPPSDILKGLKDGGFDFDVMGWREKDLLRPLAISLAKNVARFHKLKNGSFGLKSWYDEDFLKKAGRQKADAAASAALDEAEDREAELIEEE
jgi:hypothetical protein